MHTKVSHIERLIGIIMVGIGCAAHGHEYSRSKSHNFDRSDKQFVEPITPFGYEVGAGEEIVVVGADGEEYAISGPDDVDGVGADDIERMLAAAISGDEMGKRRKGMRVVRRGGMRKVVRAPIHVPGQAPQLQQSPLGFDSGGDIAAGNTLDVGAIPQTDFWGRKLMVPSDIAGNFAIVGCRVGMKNVLPGTAAIPCRAFDERSNGGAFLLPKCSFGYQITLTVLNIGGGPARFRAVWDGMIREQ